MNKFMISEKLWKNLEPLLPAEPIKPKGGRPRISNRDTFRGIVFVLRTGIQWKMLPQEMGCGSGVTCWRRLNEWQKAGVWERLHQVLLDKLGDAGKIDWSRAAVDSATVRAKKGAMQPARIRRIKENPVRSAILWSTDKEYRSR